MPSRDASIKELKQHISMLERSLDRERLGRKNAEEILRTKSMELYEKNQTLSNMKKRLEFALFASKQLVWEYLLEDDEYFMYESILERSDKVAKYGNFAYVVNGYHPDDQPIFNKAWQDHLDDKTPEFKIELRRFAGTDRGYRWLSVIGRKITDERSGKVTKVIGVLQDVHDAHLRAASYNTVCSAFLRSKGPGFIIDYSAKHIEGTDSFFAFLKTTKDALCQEALSEILPLDIIQEKLIDKKYVFTAPIGFEHKTIECEISLQNLHKRPDDIDAHRYVVGFFRPVTG